MKRTLPLLKELMDLMADFDDHATADQVHLPGFIHWLLQREKEQEKQLYDNYMVETRGTEPSGEHPMTPDILITILVTYLFRYAKHYSKKALDGSPLSTLDDFTYLLSLNMEGSMTKSELANRHLLEVTSGNEILRRLEKLEMVYTFDDPNDGRSRRVAITESGKAMLGQMMGRMKTVSSIVAGNLTAQEIARLLPILMKLDTFHHEIHQQDKKADLEEITEKYLVGSAS